MNGGLPEISGARHEIGPAGTGSGTLAYESLNETLQKTKDPLALEKVSSILNMVVYCY